MDKWQLRSRSRLSIGSQIHLHIIRMKRVLTKCCEYRGGDVKGGWGNGIDADRARTRSGRYGGQ